MVVAYRGSNRPCSVELFVPMTWPLADGVDDCEEVDNNVLNLHMKYKLSLMTPGVLEAALEVILKPLSIPFKYVYSHLIPALCNVSDLPLVIESERNETMSSFDWCLRYCETLQPSQI